MFFADKVFYNGKIYTMEKEHETVDGIAVWNGKIIARGSNQDIKSISAREYINLEGKTVLPGFADTHMHLYQDCMDRLKIDLTSCCSISEIQDKLKQGLPEIWGNNWLFGENIHADYLKEKHFPTRKELDEISKYIPIMVGSFCRHTHILNSKALELCQIEAHRHEIPEDMLEYEPDGSLNGTVKERAYDIYVIPKLPVSSLEETIPIVDKYLYHVASFGITQLHAYQQDNPNGILLYQEIRKRIGLKCRISFHFPPDFYSDRYIATGLGDDMMKVGAVKYLIDGSIGAGSALMYEDYDDLPGERGIMTYSQEELNSLVKQAYDAGNDVAVHAIGDKGNDMVLTSFENAYRPEIGWNRRFYIIHATLMSKTFIERAKNLPIILCVQPIFIRNFVNLSKSRIGSERDTRFMAFKTMSDNNLIVTAGSDAPVRELNPFHGIQCAVTRKDINGDEIISVNQEVSVYDAICMYTKNASYCVHEENLKGTITTGKVADMIVLNRNPFDCPVEELYQIKAEKTFLGGTLIYQA